MLNLSEYNLREVLYAGPATTLYRGIRSGDRAPVVIKVLSGERPSPREIARLRHEYLICQELRAPGVVNAYALERVSNGLALVLEDFGGVPLAGMIRPRRLPTEEALTIASSVAAALGAVHDRHVIHKDIKPHNILVNAASGIVKITDFGIATRLAQETHKEAAPGAMEGTLMYMSPEQTGRMNRALDYRTDFYSLGVTLYEMLTGELPFSSLDPMEIVHSHIARRPPTPRERAPDVPEALSAIVMKLLSKTVEERYQSAHGLKADLDECLDQLRAAKVISVFPLGARDKPGTLRIPQRLYGREAEIAALLAAFERAAAGAAELLLVSGYAGVGKSTLVGEVHPAIAKRGGRFCAGKFDQLGRNVPYQALGAALRELVLQRLTEPEEELARARRELLGALGSNGRLLTDLIPELALLIGPQPPVPELGPSEAQNRFGLVFQDFLRGFTTAEQPLVLFLDDLQWADPASLRLLSFLLLDPERGHLLIIGAYRDHEVGPGHLLALTLDELRKEGASVREIALAPLGRADVTRLVADTFACDLPRAELLAEVAYAKTHGNPFFLGQLLRALHEGGFLHFDLREGAWAWDLERVRAAEAAENVVEFMAGRISKLPAETQRVLVLAACIGHQFDLKTLALIGETTQRAAAAALWAALREGLVVPQSPDYLFLSEPEPTAAAAAGPAAEEAFDVSYRFLHDRVQQAAYARVSAARKQELHLRIGRLLRDQADGKAREERLFAIVDHLNLAAKRITDRGERLELARANLSAGKRAKAASAYAAALGYLDVAAALVDEACWEEAYALAFTLGIERVECAYLVGQLERAEALWGALLARATSRRDRAQVYALCILLATARGDFAGAIRLGRAALALYGIDLPETAERQQEAFEAELAAVEANLAGRSIEEMQSAPLLTDPDLRTPIELLVQLSPASFFSGPPLNCLICMMQTNLCLKYGRSELAAFSYAYSSVIHVMPLGRYREARAFFRLSHAIDEQFDAIALRGKTNVNLVTVAHFFISFKEELLYVARGQRATLETGDFLFLSFTCFHDVMPRLCAGEELSAVFPAVLRNLALAYRAKSALVVETLLVARQLVLALQGGTAGRASLSQDDYDEASRREALEGPGFAFAASFFETAKLTLALLYGDYAGALAAAARATAKAMVGGTSVFHYWTDVPFYEGLASAALWADAPEGERREHAARLLARRDTIAVWAENCPENYRHKLLLLDAEAARIEGREADADRLYDEAIEAAAASQAPHHEALAGETAARCYLARGKKKIARLYLNDAYHAYLRWGATDKALELTQRYAAIIGPPAEPPRRKDRTTTLTMTGDRVMSVDAAALVRAAQAISAELVLESLLERLIRIVVQNAGADRAALLLAREDRLVLEATMEVEPDLVRVGIGAPLEAEADLPVSVVQLVQRTTEPVVLGDATRAAQFAADPYLSARQPRSIACLSMTQKGRAAGVLYLENRALPDAFTEPRMEIAGLLLAQAAIAVENARLVAELKQRTAALGDANAALGDANRAMRTVNEKLARELAEREEAERARAALERELLRVQTPFIPITDRVAVMPLVGALDPERASQVMEAALRGAAARRARIIILDVTGVERFDDSTTQALLSATRALRMLGAESVITGIQPEMARAIVARGMELGGVVTQATLQSGIAYAMDRLESAPARGRPSRAAARG